MEILTKDQYKKAGFNDDEIFAFTSKTTEDNQKKSTEIDGKYVESIDYFDLKDFDKFQEVDTKPIQEYWQGVMGEIKDLPKTIYGEKSEFIEHIGIGLGATNWGLGAALLKGEDLPTAYQRQYGEDESFLEGLVQRGTTLAFNLPFYIAGGAAGGAVGAYFGGPAVAKFTSPFGAGFVNGSIRKTLMEAIQKKQIDEPVDYMKIFLEEGVKEGLKEGAQLSLALNAPQLLGPKLGANYFAKVLTRFTVFEGLGAAMHGQLPGGRELLYSGIFWGMSGFDGSRAKILKAEKHYKKKADEIYIQTNKKPTEILIEENLDRTIKNDNDSINTIIPKALENLVTEKVTTETIRRDADIAFKKMDKDLLDIKENLKTQEKITELKKKNQEIYQKERKKSNEDKKSTSKFYRKIFNEVEKKIQMLMLKK